MNSRNMNKNSYFKIVDVMKSTSKTELKHLLLNITFNNKYCRSQHDFLHLSLQHNNKGHYGKKLNPYNDLLLLLGFDQESHGFGIPWHFFGGPLYHACTHSIQRNALNSECTYGRIEYNTS